MNKLNQLFYLEEEKLHKMDSKRNELCNTNIFTCQISFFSCPCQEDKKKKNDHTYPQRTAFLNQAS